MDAQAKGEFEAIKSKSTAQKALANLYQTSVVDQFEDLPFGQRLPLTADATLPKLEPGCKEVQIAVIAPNGKFLRDREYWDMLPTVDQSALTHHEYWYKDARDSGVHLSDETRFVVGQIYAGHKLQPILEPTWNQKRQLWCGAGVGGPVQENFEFYVIEENRNGTNGVGLYFRQFKNYAVATQTSGFIPNLNLATLKNGRLAAPGYHVKVTSEFNPAGWELDIKQKQFTEDPAMPLMIKAIASGPLATSSTPRTDTSAVASNPDHSQPSFSYMFCEWANDPAISDSELRATQRWDNPIATSINSKAITPLKICRNLDTPLRANQFGKSTTFNYGLSIREGTPSKITILSKTVYSESIEGAILSTTLNTNGRDSKTSGSSEGFGGISTEVDIQLIRDDSGEVTTIVRANAATDKNLGYEFRYVRSGSGAHNSRGAFADAAASAASTNKLKPGEILMMIRQDSTGKIVYVDHKYLSGFLPGFEFQCR
jgi:hypothetical protein